MFKKICTVLLALSLSACASQQQAKKIEPTNIGIAHHFVVAYGTRDGLVRVADPLFGMRWDSVQSFDQRAVPIFIKVDRKP